MHGSHTVNLLPLAHQRPQPIQAPMPHWITRQDSAFPPLEKALRQPDGLLAIGGDLSAGRLVAAYRHGCFPWYSEGQPVLWWSPDPRTVLFPQELHVPRSLVKSMRKNHFRITYDRNFAAVMAACTAPREQAAGTWITPAMQEAYCELHRLGHAHSVEVWHADRLVGGLYGIAMGRLFFGESMFAHMSDASKTGFVTLVRDLQAAGFVLIDCQMPTEHLARFGAREIPRREFRSWLEQHLDAPSGMDWSAR